MASTDTVGTKTKPILQVKAGQQTEQSDLVACEEPLEIKLAFGPADNRQHRSLAITMRTPGQDEELAIGFLFTEGIIGRAEEVIGVRHVGQALSPESAENILLIELAPELPLDFDKLNRHFYTSSSCGVCGKASIEMLRAVNMYYPRKGYPVFTAGQIRSFPTQLSAQQSLFDQTGGIHASASFGPDGQLLHLREDVGRHNAMDKLIGQALQSGNFPLREQAVMVSGRLSFELVQKASMAGLPMLLAVGAPSTLAVELAEENGMTLVGFLRGARFNVYCGAERIKF
ncbi:MAG TPA: formate dehydrogenase accessory sulfurtransferase FdhD [Phaeodactylibacter sp.]|nr:formate dehydrogenase accessory sulfurtransferase FdhD [Phaeodactylibacter sp.]